MTIVVPEFAKWLVTQNAFTYNYNSLSNFSSPQDLVFDLSNFQISHTTDAYLDAKAQGNISFIPHGGGIAADIPISNVEVFGTGLTTKTLSTSYQNINSSAYSVVAGNRNTIPIKIRINANAVKEQLYKAGTYTFTVDFKIRNNGGTVSDTQSVQFTITTQPLSTIAVQGTPDVNFTFATAADYQTGKSQNMANHLLVSNNKAFEIYVKSGTSNFTLNGTPTTLPSTIVQVENGTGQTGIITKTLTTTPQAILLGAAPSLNQNISLKYTIPAAQAASLLGQTTGATPYILNVIYSFTNQ